MPSIVCISDTHEQHRSLVIPPADILIHAGDITYNGNLDKLRDFAEWLDKLPHLYKIVIAGNHDWCFQKQTQLSMARTLINRARDTYYLEDSSIKILGLKIYGSPHQPWFHSWAFNLERGPEIREMWDMIPSDTNILVTHGPPYGYGDRTNRGPRVGCKDLLTRVQEIKPLLHIFGHIHEDPGAWSHTWQDGKITTFINASSCNPQYLPVQQPILVEIESVSS